MTMKTVMRSCLNALFGKENLIKKPATRIKTQISQSQTLQMFLLHITEPVISLFPDLSFSHSQFQLQSNN